MIRHDRPTLIRYHIENVFFDLFKIPKSFYVFALWNKVSYLAIPGEDHRI